MSYVKLKRNGKILKVQMASLNAASISMIFKLNPDQGIYLVEEKEGEVILPNERGDFDILEVNNNSTYLVDGEEIASARNTASSNLGSPMYSTSKLASPRTQFNPPPSRPTFRRPVGLHVTAQSWKKSILVSEVKNNGSIQGLFQTIVNLTEETSSVAKVSALLKEQLNYEVTLLDSKHLKIVDNEATKGSQFWKSNRKIVAVKSAQYTQAKESSLGKGNKKWKPNELLSHLEDIVEAAAANVKSSPTSVNVPTSEGLKDIFKCTVCLNTSELPAACCPCCSNVIGCIPCIEQWLETQLSPTCPLCRVNERYQVIPYLAKLANLLGNKQYKPVQARAVSVVGTSASGGSSDVVSTGASTSVTSNVANTTVASNDRQGFTPLTTFQYDDDDDDDDENEFPPAFQ